MLAVRSRGSSQLEHAWMGNERHRWGMDEKSPGGQRTSGRPGRRPVEARDGGGLPSDMARNQGPVGLRRRRGRARRRRRDKLYGQGPRRGGLRRGLRWSAAADLEENQAVRRTAGVTRPHGGGHNFDSQGRSEKEQPAESRGDRYWTAQEGQSIID